MPDKLAARFRIYKENAFMQFGLPGVIPATGLVVDACSENINHCWKPFLSWHSDSLARNLYIQTQDPAGAFARFSALFGEVCAAGGLVKNSDNQTLMIHRLGHWDLPKGKIDAGELPEQTAIREVREECGLKQVKLLRPLHINYHAYVSEKGHWILKKNYWFEMIGSGSEKLIPQIQEQITQARWFETAGLATIRRQMFLSVADLVFGQF